MVSSDRIAQPIRSGASFTAPVDGWFLSDTLYQATRRAVADRVQELTPKPAQP